MKSNYGATVTTLSLEVPASIQQVAGLVLSIMDDKAFLGESPWLCDCIGRLRADIGAGHMEVTPEVRSAITVFAIIVNRRVAVMPGSLFITPYLKKAAGYEVPDYELRPYYQLRRRWLMDIIENGVAF